jgi:endoglucanase
MLYTINDHFILNLAIALFWALAISSIVSCGLTEAKAVSRFLRSHLEAINPVESSVLMINIIRLFSLSVLIVLFPCDARAATWYLQNNASGDWNTLTNWNSLALGGGTTPTSISSSDNFDLNGFGVDTPKLSSGTTTFGGHELIFHGAGAIVTKTTPPATVAIGTLVSDGGSFICAIPGTLGINITSLTVNANTTLDGNGSNLGFNFTIGTLTGGGDISALGSGGGSAGGKVLFNVGTSSAYTGTFYIVNGCQFTFESTTTLGGPLVVEGAGTAVTLNNTLTVKGLTINGVAKATGTYSVSTLGSPFTGSGSVIVQASTTPSFVVTQPYGVNFSGGESSNRNYPTKAYYWNYYHGKGLNLIRVPFSWEAVQPTLGGPLNTTALASLDTAVSLAAADGMQVVLDMHNYDRYSISGTSYLVGSTQVPYSDFQSVWALLAAHFSGEAGIYGYDIMNEPNGDSGTWVSTAAQYGVNGVRQGDTTHYVIVEGDSYAGAQSWMANNQTFNVTDSANKLIYSAHTYWDANDSGVYNGSYDSNNDYPNIGEDRVAQFLYWLSLKGAKGYVGEFGVPNNVASPDYRWNVALDNFMSDLNSSNVEGTYWGTYNLSQSYLTRPNLDNGSVCTDAPAMTVLESFGGGTAWTTQDIGSVSPAGSGSNSNGVFTVNTGSGSEIINGETSDSFTYTYQQMTGNGSIIARVASLSCTDAIKGEGGVMLRNDLTSGGAFAMTGVTTGRGLAFTTRATSGAANVSSYGADVVAPYWVEITRSGNNFSSYESTNGTSWTQVGATTTISMGTSVYVGLPLCNHGGTGTATFDNVSITQ